MAEAKVRSIESPPVEPPSELRGDLIVLPREVTAEGVGLYDDSVMTIVKDLRVVGVEASFAHDQDHRSWIGEQAAEVVVISLIIGVASNAGWWALSKLFGIERKNDQLRVKVGRCTQEEGRTTWEWYEMSGTGSAVAEAMAQIETPQDPSDTGGADEKEAQRAIEG
jgi:hypothetical protein